MGDSTLKKSPRTWRFSGSSITLCVLIIYADKLFTDFAVNGQQTFTSSEENSSPSHITAAKGSSVWLHWNYTYIGDGTHFGGGLTTFYKEQVIEINSTSQSTLKTLAKKTGSNGALTLESPVPVPFIGRVRVIPSNSTLVIHDLQYNDSAYQFSSYVNVDVDLGAGAKTNTYNMKPLVSLTVNGIPDFIKQPPDTLEVNEGSTLQLRIEMDGNPKPSADFRWPHITGSSPTNVLSAQLYPFAYLTTYTLNNIDASYCGRILQATVRNSKGSSVTASTNVTLLLKLDMDFGLVAGKIAASQCVQVQWNKAESGACYVKYQVILKSAAESDLYSEIGYNIGKMRICRLETYSNVTDVQLTVNFKANSRNFTAKVSDTPITTPASTTSESTSQSVNQNTATASSSSNSGSSGNPTTSPKTNTSVSGSNIGLIVGASIGGVIFLMIVIIVIVWFIKKLKRRRMDTNSGSKVDGCCHPNYCRKASKLNGQQPHHPTDEDPNKSKSIHGKLGENARDMPKYTRGKGESYYAHVKVNRAGYPVSGALPTL